MTKPTSAISPLHSNMKNTHGKLIHSLPLQVSALEEALFEVLGMLQ